VIAQAENTTCKVEKLSSGQNLPNFNVSVMLFRGRELKTNPGTAGGRALPVC